MGNRLWQQSGYWLAVTHREMFLHDASVPNKSISRAAMASTSVASHPWRGPVVVVRQTTDETAVEDVTMGDFRHAVDYFADYANSDTTDVEETVQSASPGSAHAEGDPRRGVKIHCLGAIKLHGKQPFSQVKVSARHPVWQEGELSSISKLVGQPVWLWKSDDISEWLDPPGWENSGTCADSNQNAAFLMMGTDPDADDWGWAPPRWQSDLGDVLVVGDQSQELAMEDVALLSYFCRKKLQPLFEDSMGLGLVPRPKEEVLEFMTGENMERFREEARQWMAEM